MSLGEERQREKSKVWGGQDSGCRERSKSKKEKREISPTTKGAMKLVPALKGTARPA